MRFSPLGSLSRPGEVLRLIRTVRHMRARQWMYAIRYRLAPPRRIVPLKLSTRALHARTPFLRHSRRAFDGVSAFTFLNRTRAFDGDWNPADEDMLWRYNLHYMDWLDEVGSARETWMQRWIGDNPPDSRGAGWDPYPLSMRLWSWIRSFVAAGTMPGPVIAGSMGVQAGALLGQLEFHLDANHLLENLLALASACLLADTSDPATLAARSRVCRLLETELEAQFLPDGGHYELSPMYHSLLLERMLDLLNLWPEDAAYHPSTRVLLAARSQAMLGWLASMEVGGEIALFNDAAHGIAVEPRSLLDYGSRLLASPSPEPARPLAVLAASGYVRAERGDWILIFDAGRLAPDHQMGHAHCDMLSFCLWYRDRPLLVHPGTYQYKPGAMRDYCRSTAAHNTVAIPGAEQAELWGAHRVGRRGYPLEAEARVEADGTVVLRAAHGAYAHLPGSPIHRRSLRLSADGLVGRDELAGPGIFFGTARFHFHPDCVLSGEAGEWRVHLDGRGFVLRCDLPLLLEEGWYCPEFGKRIVSRRLAAKFGPGPCGWSLTGLA